MSQENIRARFIAIAESADKDILLDEAALVIAAETEEDVDVDTSIEQLNQMARQFESHFIGDISFGIPVSRLVDYIHEELKFSGNVRDYYDPSNSYLNRVIEHKVGIPITLAIIHIALGQRLDIPVSGVNFPGHFLVKYGDENRLLTILFPAGS